jgi:hypothetical protein
MRNAFEPEIEIIASQFPSVNQTANFKEKNFIPSISGSQDEKRNHIMPSRIDISTMRI